MRTWIFILMGLVSVPAGAATDVHFAFTPESSAEWGKLWFGDSNMQCEVFAKRPGRTEEAAASPENRIVCMSLETGVRVGLSFGDTPVDYWGQENEASFQIEGGTFTSILFEKFRERTANLPEADRDQMWTRIALCGPYGIDCTQMFFLNTIADGDAPAQVACSGNSSLKREAAVEPGLSKMREIFATTKREDYPSEADYIEALTTKQIQAGLREIRNQRCTFIAP